jgi:hypothetical protein
VPLERALLKKIMKQISINVMIIGVVVAFASWPVYRHFFNAPTTGQKLVTHSTPDAQLGYSEVRCIEGYKFILGYRGSPTQIIDSQGHGIVCNVGKE